MHIGGHQNGVRFSEDDEEDNDGCWGICLVFPVTGYLNGGS